MPTCCPAAPAYGPGVLYLVVALFVVWRLLNWRAEARAVRADLAALVRAVREGALALAACRSARLALALALGVLLAALLLRAALGG